MDIIQKLLLPISIALILVGTIFSSLSSIVIPLGFILLIIGYIFEKVFLKNKYYRLTDFSSKKKAKELMIVKKSDLIISDKWSLDGSLKIQGFEGTYTAEVIEKFKDDFSLISKLRISNHDELQGEAKKKSSSITVDTGWLLFISSLGIEKYTESILQKTIQGELKRLSSDNPLCIWLDNENNENIGVIVSTGEGDGSYKIKYDINGDKLSFLEVEFL